jgi:hypothetical protein
VRIEDGQVVDDGWVPARIGTAGRPRILTGKERQAAVSDWDALRGCAGLATRPAS